MADFTVYDFTQPDHVLQFGMPPVRVDVMTTINGVTFAEAWSNRVQTHWNELPIFLISLQDLIRNKEAAGRDTDQIHLNRLRKYGK